MTDLEKAKELGRISGSDREFRDALTRAVGAAKGENTEAMQWDRWTP